MKIIKNKDIIKDDEIEEVKVEEVQEEENPADKIELTEEDYEEAYPEAKTLLYGYNYDNLNHDWTKSDVEVNLDKFFGNDFGIISEDQKAKNMEAKKNQKGDMLGIYSKGNRENDMVIYYDDTDKNIYVLLRSDFESPKEAWLSGLEDYREEYYREDKGGYRFKGKYDPKDEEEYKEYTIKVKSINNELEIVLDEISKLIYKHRNVEPLTEAERKEYDKLVDKRARLRSALSAIKSDPNQRYTEYGHELNEAQKESLRASSKTAEELYKSVPKIVKEKGINSMVETIAKQVESGKLPKDTIEVLTKLAEENGGTYRQAVEKVKEQVETNNMNTEKAINTVIKKLNQKLPYYFNDAIVDPRQLREEAEERKRLLSIGYNQKSIANILSKWLPQMTNDIDEGRVSSEELAKQAINVIRNELNTPYVNEKFIPSIKKIMEKEYKYDYYKVSDLLQYFYNIILKTEGLGVIKSRNSKFDSVKKILKDSIAKIKAKDEKPAWLEEDLIDDIVYSKDWPTTIEEVAEALMKYGIKDRHEAIGYVKEYLNDNPAELKHFKTTKDSKVKDSKVKDSEEFLEKTSQGFDVHGIYKDENNRLYVIAYRPLRKDWLVGAGYNPSTGLWGQGYYDFTSKTGAIRYLFNHYPDNEFDIYWEK